MEVRDAVDLACETGAGTRTVLVRAGTMRPDANPPIDTAPSDERPWLVGMERLDDPRLARRFVTSRLLYRRLRRYLWAPPLVLAAIALLLRVDFVVDGLGHVFRSPRQQNALQRAYDATWFSRFVVTVVIAVLLLAVLAVVVAATSRGIWRALGGDGLPAPWAGGVSGTGPSHTPSSRSTARTPSTPPGPPSRRARRASLPGGARARADPPRRGVLRLPGSHLGGGPRAPRAIRAARRPSSTTARSPRSRSRPARTCTSA